ncbi:hypothetical protein [Streptomyces sp. NBC_00154]|uniref:hypothetical protein n=1 Tax=Streptomyces sp. NBC_00154 TaxID=2975670 RepID=UPI00225651D2|nr:hypothetical protein [Streptomyces sp. NBC_00154]MCX5318132.1 hypothetical protein [Streptomyces sp. NBC_00154]
MDAGVAAVAGAVVGVVGTTVAGVLTAWATRGQARIQARAQQNQWLRQVRRDVYVALMTADSATEDLVLGLRHAVSQAPPDLQEADRRLHQAPELLGKLKFAALTVGLEGPLGALSRASEVQTTTFDTLRELTALRDLLASNAAGTAAVDEAKAKVQDSIERMQRAGSAFIRFASEVLSRDEQ